MIGLCLGTDARLKGTGVDGGGMVKWSNLN